MPLLGAGIADSNGNIFDNVRGVLCLKEASVTGGATTTDSGTKYISETHNSTTTGNRIDLGVFGFKTNFTFAVRFIYRTQSTNYNSIASRGSVFENDTQFAFGVRDTTTSHFSYARNGAGLLGTEGSSFSMVNGTIYTLLLRWKNGTQEDWLLGTNVGGAGVDQLLLLSSASGDPSNGGQHIYLGGPNTPSANDTSGNFGILGFLYYDNYIDDTLKASIRDNFYNQIPFSKTVKTNNLRPHAFSPGNAK